MSSSIWTQSAASSKIRALAAEPWRVVEAQHRISTRKLVGSDREQWLLEELIEIAKPPAVDGGLHYLLSTPFRYPPLRHGSRFGTRWEAGIWYGSDTVEAAFAEVAYYRLLFLDGTDADLGTIETELSAFQAPVKTRRGLDLSARAFVDWHEALGSKARYAATQPFGASMRQADVEVFRYRSARDPQSGTNIGLLSPRAFTVRRPRRLETWRSASTTRAVEFSAHDYFDRRAVVFAREQFEVDGVLPNPGSLSEFR